MWLVSGIHAAADRYRLRFDNPGKQQSSNSKINITARSDEFGKHHQDRVCHNRHLLNDCIWQRPSGIRQIDITNIGIILFAGFLH